ncbi:MAG: exodeoxyribonuclease VII small subunit [Nitrospirae bacterium]|nr:exodeoxyribonuclease VII small subunit [Nitrospirota bacterium]MBI3391614.1 exodeoxyribonuclease VII small subunit [Nitrospirota bacterium]
MAEPKFEQALKRLEQIVDSLEGGALSLEESLKVFEEGVKLARLCARKLEEAERKVEILTIDAAGKKTVQPWSETAAGGEVSEEEKEI